MVCCLSGSKLDFLAFNIYPLNAKRCQKGYPCSCNRNNECCLKSVGILQQYCRKLGYRYCFSQVTCSSNLKLSCTNSEWKEVDVNALRKIF